MSNDPILSEIPKLTYYRGRVAMAAILKALGIRKGDHVATQAFTCLAVPEGILSTGATIDWIDAEANGVNIDPASLRARVTDKTRAIIVQHTFGIPAQLDEIMAIANERGIPVIEDCCHTLTSRYAGKRVGQFGVGAFFSFEWGKPVIAGLGGSAIVNDVDLRKKVEADYATFTAPDKSLLKLQIQYHAFGLLYRPSTYWTIRDLFQKLSASGAAEGNYNPIEDGKVAEDFHYRMAGPLQERLKAQLKQFDSALTKFRLIAGRYEAEIRSSAVESIATPEGADTDYARYPLLASDKPRLLALARERKVELADWYSTPIHPTKEAGWKSIGYDAGHCPNAERQANRVVSLPVNRKTTSRDIDKTVAFLNGAQP